VVAEVNCGWVRFWLENMDQNFEQQRHWARLLFDRPPSGYAGVNVFVTTLDDHVGFAAMRQDPRLADGVMFSIDYPHSVTLWPESQRHVAELTRGLTPEARTSVLSATADRLYRFDAGRAA
jgi:predicted TIM-barrel fold metal-dependent hydrolase